MDLDLYRKAKDLQCDIDLLTLEIGKWQSPHDDPPTFFRGMEHPSKPFATDLYSAFRRQLLVYLEGERERLEAEFKLL